MTGLDVLVTALQADPMRIAVEHRNGGITAGALLAKVHAVAAHLRSAGLAEGDRLGVIVLDNVMALQLTMASWMCGATPLHLDMRQSVRNLADWHARMGFRFLVGPSACSWVGGPEALSVPQGLPSIARLPWKPPSDGDLVADYFLSSGTTGVPKVKPVTQKRLAELIEQWLASVEHGMTGVALSAQSVAYPASRAVWYRNLATGRKIVALDLLFTLRELDSALLRPDVEQCTLAPVLIRRLTRLPERGPGPRYPHLSKLWCVGGPATADDKLRAVTRLTMNYEMTYSSTDCGVATRISGAEILARPASCGRAVPKVRLEIRHGDRICGPGETGTIRVYREGSDPAEPGDLGWLDADGYLYIVGRSNGLMCRKGVNVSVAQVEQALLACDLVDDAVVWSTRDEDDGDFIHATIECPLEAEAAIGAFVRRRLSSQERPDRIVFARRLPRSPGGKPDRLLIAMDYGVSAEPIGVVE